MAVKPNISVIVPFFNIEECIGYCLDSLLSQTYEDYEIVCVDDGSIDHTGEVLDEYASRYDRVKAFHTLNAGLSAARNYGVEASSGDFVSFVDGDDIVSPYYLESLVAAREKTGADFVIGTTRRVRSKDVICFEFGKPQGGHEIRKEDLVEGLLYERLLPSACANLAPKDFYLRNPFPVGAYYEEIATMGANVRQADRIAIIEDPIYGYVMRSNSIVHTRRTKAAQNIDYQKAKEKFLADIERVCDLPEDGVRYFSALHDTRMYRLLQTVDDEDFRTSWSRRTRNDVRQNLQELMSDPNVSKGNRVRFFLVSKYPRTYLKLFAVYDFIRG